MSGQRNVILVTVDSLRADHCGFMGYDHNTTPTLNRMARDGFSFDAAIAPGPSTYESMPAAFTGRHMIDFRSALRTDEGTSGAAISGRGSEGRSVTEEDAIDVRTRNIRQNMHTETIAEWFARQGYTTGAFTTNPYTGGHTAFARGFDDYEDFMSDGEGLLMRKAAHVPVLSELKHVVTLLRGDRASKPWSDYVDRVREWIDRAPEPYFLWLFLLDTHTPYLPAGEYRSEVGQAGMYYHNWRLWAEKKWRDTQDPSALDRESLVTLYDAAIRSVDDFLGMLQSDASRTDAAIVVHADHGEAFGEHGTYGHEAQLYEENLHVPLVVGNVDADGHESAPVSLTVLPQLLRTVASGSTADLTELTGGPVLARSFDGGRVAIRGRDWKYVCDQPAAGRDIDGGQFYNLDTDSAEQSPRRDEAIPDGITAYCHQRLHRRFAHERECTAVVARVTDQVAGTEH